MEDVTLVVQMVVPEVVQMDAEAVQEHVKDVLDVQELAKVPVVDAADVITLVVQDAKDLVTGRVLRVPENVLGVMVVQVVPVVEANVHTLAMDVLTLALQVVATVLVVMDAPDVVIHVQDLVLMDVLIVLDVQELAQEDALEDVQELVLEDVQVVQEHVQVDVLDAQELVQIHVQVQAQNNKNRGDLNDIE